MGTDAPKWGRLCITTAMAESRHCT